MGCLSRGKINFLRTLLEVIMILRQVKELKKQRRLRMKKDLLEMIKLVMKKMKMMILREQKINHLKTYNKKFQPIKILKKQFSRRNKARKTIRVHKVDKARIIQTFTVKNEVGVQALERIHLRALCLLKLRRSSQISIQTLLKQQKNIGTFCNPSEQITIT